MSHNIIGHVFDTSSAEVEKGRLRSFARAIGETNPVYLDETAARAAGYPGLPVPPTFLFCLEMEGRDIMDTLNVLGFDLGRILHGEQSFTYHRMCFAGDTLSFAPAIADFYEKKGGALQFAVRETRVTNQHGEHVADLRATLVQR